MEGLGSFSSVKVVKKDRQLGKQNNVKQEEISYRNLKTTGIFLSG